jgi:hypothetical protein
LNHWVFSVTPENFRIAFEKSLWAVDSLRKKDSINNGDRIAFYVKGTYEFRGAVEVIGQWYRAAKPTWHEELEDNKVYWQWQVQTRWLATGRVGAKSISNQLNFVANKSVWYVYLMGAPANFRRPIPEVDFATIVSQMQAIGIQPKQTQTQTTKNGGTGSFLLFESGDLETTHTEIQYLLVKLGKIGGCEIWVPKPDRSRSFNDEELSTLTLDALPQLGFPERANRIVENIDVIWLRKETILGAFEVEHTTSIYGGLLRMSDLITVLPNLRFPLFLVVPDERREKAKQEITRPTFEHLNPPLSKTCRIWTYDDLVQLHEEVSKARFPPTWTHEYMARLGEGAPI